MTFINMRKTVTIMRDGYYPYCRQYKELEKELENDFDIEVSYAQGMKKAKEWQLSKLGYTLKKEIWTPNPETDPIYADIRGIWTKK